MENRDGVSSFPNVLSFSRLILTPFILLALLYQREDLALLVLLLAGLTDLLDGFFARRWKSQTRLGLLIDPVADKFLVLSLLGYFFLLDEIPWWYMLTVFGRDFFQLSGAFVLKLSGRPWLAPANIYGKAATLGNISAILMTILSQWKGVPEGILSFVFITGASLTFVSFVSYCGVWWRLYRGEAA